MAEKNTTVKLTPFEQEQIAIAKQVMNYKLAAEANVVSILYKVPDYLYESILCLDDFSNNTWKVFFQIIYDLVIVENKTAIDSIVIGIYLEKHPKLRAKYEEYGGYTTIQNAMEYVQSDNFYGYVTELKKWKCVIELCKQGFPIKDSISQFVDMSAEDIYKRYETRLNHVFINTDDNVKTFNAFDGIHNLIDDLDSCKEEGFPFYNAKLLTEMVGGFNYHGNIYGLGAGSGVGKSTMAFNYLVPSAIKENKKIIFIINEEDERKFKKELLVWVANNIFIKKPEEYIHKYMIRKGHFDEKTKEILKQCADWIEEQKEKRILTIIPLERYSVRTVIKIIKKYSTAYGVKLFVLDTFKESFDAKTDEIFKSMMRDMVALYDVIKPRAKNVGLFVTYQLGKGSLKMRHLTNNEIGQAKSIIDVMSVNLMMRRPYENEYDGGSKALECWYVPEEAKGYTKVEYKLKRENHPMITFVTKNRFGETDTKQIISEADFSTNICKDVAYCIVPQDW